MKTNNQKNRILIDKKFSKYDSILCKYIEDYPDIQKSSIHLSPATIELLKTADQIEIKRFFYPIYKSAYIIFVEINKETAIANVYTSDEDWKMQFYNSLNDNGGVSTTLLALPGTKLESTLKNIYSKFKSELDSVPEMVAELTGIKPINMGYYWYEGITCNWSYDYLQFPESTNPKNVISFMYKDQLYYKPDKELNIVKKFIVEWHKKYRGLCGYELAHYIPKILFMPWIPCYVNKRYGIQIPSSFCDKLGKGEQFDIQV